MWKYNILSFITNDTYQDSATIVEDEEKDEDGYDVDQWIRIKKNRRKCLECEEELKPCSRCHEQKQRDNFEKEEWERKLTDASVWSVRRSQKATCPSRRCE